MSLPIDKLHRDGYVLFPRLLDNRDLNSFEKSIINSKLINYGILKHFIDIRFVPKVNRVLRWNTIYTKFRFSSSENSNLKDASNFHGDLYNFTNENIIPIYTGLCNLDTSTLELIPRSHLKNSIKDINDRMKLTIHPGDVLIFHSNLHHRGISSNNKRRLLQIFEIFPNFEIFNLYHEKVLIVLTNKCILMKLINNINGILAKSVSDKIGFLDKIHYWTVKRNIQYKVIGLDISNDEKENRIVGYLPGDIKLFTNDNDKWNINIVTYPHETIYPSMKIYYLLFFIIIFTLGIFYILFLKYRSKIIPTLKKLY